MPSEIILLTLLWSYKQLQWLRWWWYDCL